MAAAASDHGRALLLGSHHAGTLTQLAGMLAGAVERRAMVRQQLPVRLSDDSEPQPDIAVVTARRDHYKASHPSAAEVLLVVEISDATLRYDREVKVQLYARRGVPEVWIVDLKNRQILFHRAPADGKYLVISTVTEPRLTPIAALPGAVVDLSPLTSE